MHLKVLLVCIREFKKAVGACAAGESMSDRLGTPSRAFPPVSGVPVRSGLDLFYFWPLRCTGCECRRSWFNVDWLSVSLNLVVPCMSCRLSNPVSQSEGMDSYLLFRP